MEFYPTLTKDLSKLLPCLILSAGRANVGFAAVRDNAVGSLIRAMVHRSEEMKDKQIYDDVGKAIMDNLPMTEDFEESKVVARNFVTLLARFGGCFFNLGNLLLRFWLMWPGHLMHVYRSERFLVDFKLASRDKLLEVAISVASTPGVEEKTKAELLAALSKFLEL
jgi:hypothetical protein